MTPLTPDARRTVDEYWAAETRCRPDDLNVDSVAVAVRPAADGSDYIHHLRRRRRLQITCSQALADSAPRMVAGHAHDAVFDAGQLAARVSPCAARIVDAAYLGYRRSK
jgi:hypothetical protein